MLRHSVIYGCLLLGCGTSFAQDTLLMPSFPDDAFFEPSSEWTPVTLQILPIESDRTVVPATEKTETSSWFDQQQKELRDQADNFALKLDQLFGETQTNDPASATLRLILDQTWNKYDSYHIRPRLRGKIRLPVLENKFSLVFGDDNLDNEWAKKIHPDAGITDTEHTLDRTRSREENTSLALRWHKLSQYVPFTMDLDLGIRAGSDLYLRFEAARSWNFDHHLKLDLEQIYRYGIHSKNYFRTNISITHHQPRTAFLANQLSLIFSDEQQDNMLWDNYSFRQHQFFYGNHFNYGIYTGGYANDSHFSLNKWGPFVSWRQPFLREWFYIQTDVNFLNNRRENYAHHPGILFRMEAIF